MNLAAALKKIEYYNKNIPMPVRKETVRATAHIFIVTPLSGRWTMLRLFSAHPPMEERIRRLEAMAGKA